MIQARINKIIDSSVVDGPGNRTAIFFQGCNLNCRYCHNPETINLCRHCALCVATCPSRALSMKDGKIVWNSKSCSDCDTCLRTCPYDSSPKTRLISVEELVEHIRLNLPFIRGITLSGGECTLNADFIKELFQKTKKLGLSNLLDSNGTYDFEKAPELLKDCDGVMLDIKAYDAAEHARITDHDNDVILKNARYLARIGMLDEIRTVVIPQALNNHRTVDLITMQLASYLTIRPIRYKLIRYRPIGVRKRYSIYQQPDDELMEELASIAKKNGFNDITLI